MACTKLVLVVTLHFMLCSPPWSASPRCSSSWPVWTRRTVSSKAVACARRVLPVTMHPRCFLVSVRRPTILGIMAVWTRRTVAGIGGFHALRAVFPGSQAPDV